jgi:hypothetical protein
MVCWRWIGSEGSTTKEISNERKKTQQPHPWKSKGAAPRGNVKSRTSLKLATRHGISGITLGFIAYGAGTANAEGKNRCGKRTFGRGRNSDNVPKSPLFASRIGMGNLQVRTCATRAVENKAWAAPPAPWSSTATKSTRSKEPTPSSNQPPPDLACATRP